MGWGTASADNANCPVVWGYIWSLSAQCGDMLWQMSFLYLWGSIPGEATEATVMCSPSSSSINQVCEAGR